jgi:uncharacterized membrane protein
MGILGLEGIRQVQNTHPIFVHFAIALAPLALLFYAAAILGKRSEYRAAARTTLVLALISILVSMVTGFKATSDIGPDFDIQKLLGPHTRFGVAIVASGLAVTLWSLATREGIPRAPYLFLGLLTLVNLLILQNADIGARMVLVHGAGVEKAAPLLPPPPAR